MRQTQERLIGAPILQQLNARYAEAAPGPRLLALLDQWRGRPVAEQGYGPGNVINLRRLLRSDLRKTNVSRLALRQVYLQGVEAQDASLASAGLAGAVLNEAFAYPTSVALSADGALLAAGTPNGRSAPVAGGGPHAAAGGAAAERQHRRVRTPEVRGDGQ